jgi:hypothetical protein
MGMYFNTPATITLMQALNARYGTSATTGLSHNRTTDLGHLNAGYTLQQLWNTFGVTLTSAGSPGGDTNLKNWLKASTTLDNGLATSVHDAIVQALKSYLADQNAIAIEWFAIPSRQIVAHFPPQVSDHTTGQYSYVIAIETVTVDKVSSFVREYKIKKKNESRKSR